MMTRKHYIATAARFADMMEGNSPVSDANFIAGYARAIGDAANAMADMFAADNPRFDRQKFLTAARCE